MSTVHREVLCHEDCNNDVRADSFTTVSHKFRYFRSASLSDTFVSSTIKLCMLVSRQRSCMKMVPRVCLCRSVGVIHRGRDPLPDPYPQQDKDGAIPDVRGPGHGGQPEVLPPPVPFPCSVHSRGSASKPAPPKKHHPLQHG
eukprot:scaffold150527_cov33-Prasinocladus_malaysianus.AAC.2